MEETRNAKNNNKRSDCGVNNEAMDEGKNLVTTPPSPPPQKKKKTTTKQMSTIAGEFWENGTEREEKNKEEGERDGVGEGGETNKGEGEEEE